MASARKPEHGENTAAQPQNARDRQEPRREREPAGSPHLAKPAPAAKPVITDWAAF